MLVKFAVEPDALEAEMSAIVNLLNCWEKKGIMENGIGSETIGSKIDSLKQTFNDRWVQALIKKSATNPKFSRAFNDCKYIDVRWEDIEKIEDLDSYKSKFDIALIEEHRAIELGVDDHSIFVYRACADIEATVLGNVHLTAKIQQLDILAQNGIQRSETIDNIWQEWFYPLAMYATEVVIVDRYAFKRIDTQSNGLFRLLELFNRDSTVSSVTIYSNKSKLSQSDIKSQLDKQFKTYNNIRELKVYMPRAQDFGTYGHDRHIRFDDFRACTIGIGPEEVFQNDILERGTDFSYKYGSVQIGSLLQKEKKLKEQTGQNYQFTLQKP